MASMVTFQAFGQTLTLPKFASRPSASNPAKFHENRFAVAYRNDFGFVNVRGYETLEAANAAVETAKNSALVTQHGHDFDESAYVIGAMISA